MERASPTIEGNEMRTCIYQNRLNNLMGDMDDLKEQLNSLIQNSKRETYGSTCAFEDEARTLRGAIGFAISNLTNALGPDGAETLTDWRDEAEHVLQCLLAHAE